MGSATLAGEWQAAAEWPDDVTGAAAGTIASLKTPAQQSGVSGAPTQQYSTLDVKDKAGAITLLDTLAAILSGVEVGADVTNAVGGLLAAAFAKANAADPDTADSIPPGLTHVVTSNVYVDGSGRVFALRDAELAEDDEVANLRRLFTYTFGTAPL